MPKKTNQYPHVQTHYDKLFVQMLAAETPLGVETASLDALRSGLKRARMRFNRGVIEGAQKPRVALRGVISIVQRKKEDEPVENTYDVEFRNEVACPFKVLKA